MKSSELKARILLARVAHLLEAIALQPDAEAAAAVLEEAGALALRWRESIDASARLERVRAEAQL